MTSAPAPDAPLVATLDYVPGFPCITITPFAFYGEQTAKLLQVVDHCLQSGKVDEIEVWQRFAGKWATVQPA